MGTGIGLALSKGFVEKHDGSIEVVSDGKSGTLFRVTLPRGEKYKGAKDLVKQMPEVPQPQKNEFEENIKEKEWKDFDRKPRLIIVEDDEQLKAYLLKLLSPNYEVKSASNGKEALEISKKEKPDL